MSFVDSHGDKHLVLIEWKYTESYLASEKIGQGKFDEGSSGETRRSRYEALFDAADGPVRSKIVSLGDLGFEPFYQFLRQQLLAQALEPEYSSVRVAHIAPKANRDFALVTPERLRLEHPGLSATQVWPKLLRRPKLFRSVYTEDLFAHLLDKPPVGLERWAEYIGERYSFIHASK